MIKCFLVLIAISTNITAQTIFKASYELSWGAVSLGKVNHQLSENNGIYTFTSEAKPEGLAKLFTDDFYEKSQFKFNNRTINPIYYYSKKSNATADIFNFSNNNLAISGKKNLKIVDIEPNTLDYLSSVYALMSEAQQGKTRVEFVIYDYQPELSVLIHKKTSAVRVKAGDFEAKMFEKLKTDNNELRIWLAPTLKYLPIKIEKINSSGREFTMELLSFELP